jgi:hypothetical protein
VEVVGEAGEEVEDELAREAWAVEAAAELVALVVAVGGLGEGAEDAVADLAGGGAGEGAGEDRVRRGAAGEDLQVAVGELVGLAGAGGGEDADVLHRRVGGERRVGEVLHRRAGDVVGVAQDGEDLGARAGALAAAWGGDEADLQLARGGGPRGALLVVGPGAVVVGGVGLPGDGVVGGAAGERGRGWVDVSWDRSWRDLQAAGEGALAVLRDR